MSEPRYQPGQRVWPNSVNYRAGIGTFIVIRVMEVPTAPFGSAYDYAVARDTEHKPIDLRWYGEKELAG